jgi:hypothetical protein
MHTYKPMSHYPTKMHRLKRRLLIASAAILAPVLCLAAKEFSMPKTQPAFSYPAHDHHAGENVTVAVDPYDIPAKANIFVVNYKQHELLPVLLIITNDSEDPIQLTTMKAELVTADRTKLTPDTEEDILRRISHPTASGTHYPVPFPTPKAKGGVNAKTRDEVQNAQFRARAVEPRSSQVGFLFFDVSDMTNPLAGSRLYLTGVRNSAGNELMYFEVPLDKYLESEKQH